MDLSFNDQNLSFMSFGADAPQHPEDSIGSPIKHASESQKSTDNSQQLNSDKFLDGLGDDIIGEYLAEASKDLTSFTKPKHYENPTLVFNSHKTETRIELIQKPNSYNFQIKNSYDFYSLRDNLDKWVSYYNNYSNHEFFKFEEDFRPGDVEYSDAKLLIQTNKSRLNFIEITCFQNGVLRIKEKSGYSTLKMILKDFFCYYDQFDDDIDEFYMVNLEKWKSDKKKFDIEVRDDGSPQKKQSDQNMPIIGAAMKFTQKNIFNKPTNGETGGRMTSLNTSKISPEEKMNLCNQSERFLANGASLENSFKTQQGPRIGRRSLPSKSVRASSRRGKSSDLFQIDRHTYDDLLEEIPLNEDLSNCSFESGFSDAESFITTKSNLRKDAAITHPFLQDYILVFSGKVLEDKMIGKGFYINGNLFFEGKWVESYPSQGCVELFYPTGVLWYKGGMKKGKKKSYGIDYYPSGNKKAEGQFKDNELNDKNALVYSAEGFLEFKGKISKGVRNGPGETYWKNGNKKMSGNWVNSLCSAKNGKIYREIDGSLEYSGPLDCNNREGFGTEYYANGKIRYTGVFACNKYEDKNVSLLSEEGRLVYKGDMKNGLRNGHGVLYHEDSRKKY